MEKLEVLKPLSGISNVASATNIKNVTSLINKNTKPTTSAKMIPVKISAQKFIGIIAGNKIPIARETLNAIKQRPYITIPLYPIGYRNGEWVYVDDGTPFTPLIKK